MAWRSGRQPDVALAQPRERLGRRRTERPQLQGGEELQFFLANLEAKI
jgi:hypothetical protein